MSLRLSALGASVNQTNITNSECIGYQTLQQVASYNLQFDTFGDSIFFQLVIYSNSTFNNECIQNSSFNLNSGSTIISKEVEVEQEEEHIIFTSMLKIRDFSLCSQFKNSLNQTISNCELVLKEIDNNSIFQGEMNFKIKIDEITENDYIVLEDLSSINFNQNIFTFPKIGEGNLEFERCINSNCISFEKLKLELGETDLNEFHLKILDDQNEAFSKLNLTLSKIYLEIVDSSIIADSRRFLGDGDTLSSISETSDNQNYFLFDITSQSLVEKEMIEFKLSFLPSSFNLIVVYNKVEIASQEPKERITVLFRDLEAMPLAPISNDPMHPNFLFFAAFILFLASLSLITGLLIAYKTVRDACIKNKIKIEAEN